MLVEYRIMMVFIFVVIVNSYNMGQEVCFQGNFIVICLEQFNDLYFLLCQWVVICFGRIWQNFDLVRWCGVRDSVYEKFYSFFFDFIFEVCCVVVFVFGMFVGNFVERMDYFIIIDYNVVMMLVQLVSDGSFMVWKELVVVLSYFVVQYESNFCIVVLQFIEEEKNYFLFFLVIIEGGSLILV